MKLMGSVRERLRRAPLFVARRAARLHPNFLTALGLLFALLTPPVAYLTKSSLYAAATASLSMLMDALDGAVARLRGSASKRGAFIDSLADRLSDASIVLALYLLGCSYLLVYAVAVLSMVISYIRARAESLGVGGLAEVGIMTREFRCLFLLSIYLLHHMFGARVADYALAVLLAALGATVVQRGLYVLKALGGRRNEASRI